MQSFFNHCCCITYDRRSFLNHPHLPSLQISHKSVLNHLNILKKINKTSNLSFLTTNDLKMMSRSSKLLLLAEFNKGYNQANFERPRLHNVQEEANLKVFAKLRFSSSQKNSVHCFQCITAKLQNGIICMHQFPT